MRPGPHRFALFLLPILLLSILWISRANASPVIAVPGTIEFLDADGVTPVSYISLNGPAATVGIQLRISDKDLDGIIKREGDNADVLDASRRTSRGIEPLAGEKWFDLQDMNEDGRTDSRDIRALDSEGNSVVTGTEIIWYDRTNGILRVPDAANKLEYWIKTKTTLGAGSPGGQAGGERQGKAIYASLTNGSTIPVPPGHSLLSPGYGWIDVLEARSEGLKTRQDMAVVEALLMASIRAYNKRPADPNEGDLRIDAFFTPSSIDGQPPARGAFGIIAPTKR